MSIEQNLQHLVQLGETYGINTSIVEELQGQIKGKAPIEVLNQWNQLVKEYNQTQSIDRAEELLSQMKTLINENEPLEDKMAEVSRGYNDIENWREYSRLYDSLDDLHSQEEIEATLNKMKALLEDSGRKTDDFDKYVEELKQASMNPIIKSLNQWVDNFNGAKTIDEQEQYAQEIKRILNANPEFEVPFDIEQMLWNIEGVKEYQSLYMKTRDEIIQKYNR